MSANSLTSAENSSPPKIVIIGAGFAGIAVARELRDCEAAIAIVDRNNHHLFQPFLFQVATSILEPAEIAAPIRSLLSDMSNVRVEMREAKRVDTSRRVVVMSEGVDLPYDLLVVATGAQTSYFGHPEWAQYALGLKSLADAVAARNRLLSAFERAEMESDPVKQAREMTVVVVGGGPTGVAITGTISEFIQRTLSDDFRNIDVARARIVLVESGPRLLLAFSESHSNYAARALKRAGVELRLGIPVTQVDSAGVTIGEERVDSATVLWCTGVQGLPIAGTLGVEVRPNGTVPVEDDLSVPGHPECFVIGDAAHVVGSNGRPLPGLASIAQQQGRFVGKLIAARVAGTTPPLPPEACVPSKLATITRRTGIAEWGKRSITGFPAWLAWGLFHLRNVSGGHSRMAIIANWLRLLVTYRRSSRLIVEPTSATAISPQIRSDEPLSDTCEVVRLQVASGTERRRSGLLFLLLFLALASSAAGFAQPQSTNENKGNDTSIDPAARVFQLSLPPGHMLEDWGGVRSKLEESGITPRWFVITDVAGNPTGGRSQGATQASSTEFSFYFDLDRMAGLKGGSVFTSFSERWGHRLSSSYVGNVFSEQQIYGFETFRVIDVSYQQKLFKDRLELRLGRFAQTDDFLDSPYNYGLMSNAFCGNPFGILLDAPGMQAYTGTWGALGKVRPTARTHVMAGVYNGDPAMREIRHHGLDLSMRGPLFAIGEIGYRANGLPGDSERLGNYKAGAWYDHSKLNDFQTGASKVGSWGFYGLFDQVLIPLGAPGSNRGFGAFGSVTVAPESHIQQLPLFATAGISARGLFDTRPRDAVSLGIASGYFSNELQRAQRSGLLVPPEGGIQDNETIAEISYRIDLRKGAYFVQPDFQYIVKPGGTGRLADAPVFGAQFGIFF